MDLKCIGNDVRHASNQGVRHLQYLRVILTRQSERDVPNVEAVQREIPKKAEEN